MMEERDARPKSATTESGGKRLTDIEKRLRRWDRWRCGKGEYRFAGDPEHYIPFPMPETPKELGELIEEAATVLAILARVLETGELNDLATLREVHGMGETSPSFWHTALR